MCGISLKTGSPASGAYRGVARGGSTLLEEIIVFGHNMESMHPSVVEFFLKKIHLCMFSIKIFSRKIKKYSPNF
jgi:hypothetical protein